MSVFIPDYIFERVTAISIERLKSMGIKALILDVDNTLTQHGSQTLDDDIALWLETLKLANIKLMIASNNVAKRVQPFANKINLDFTAFCVKPLPFGLMRACKAMNVNKHETALVGDQIFTDTLAAHFYGIPMLMVNPIHEDYIITIRIKRFLEKPFIARYYKNGKELISAHKKKEDIQK